MGNAQQRHPVEMQAYQNLSEMSEPERLHFFQSQEAVFKSKRKTFSQDPPLDQAFVALEGVVNGDFFEDYEDFELIEVDDATVDLPYYETSNGKFVTSADYLQAYTDLHNIVNSAVDFSSDEDLLMLDLEISSIDEQNQIVVISSNAYVATLQQQQWFIPGSSYWAAVGAGPCSTPANHDNQGNDAADFMNAYANGTAPWKSRCTTTVYSAPVAAIYTYNKSISDYQPTTTTEYNDWIANFVAPSWRSNTNQCLGNSNEEWLGLYQDMDGIISYGLGLVQNDFPAGEFYLTRWHSHDSQRPAFPVSRFRGQHDEISERYFHAGLFAYAIITC